ncbi:MAG: 16S rRNA (uracil(1498)-N(3))-methyltransferase [Pseudomonadota bacterium]
MRSPRIFHPEPLTAHSRVNLNDNAARHVARVLRLTEGASLTLFDGTGGQFPASIISSSKRTVEVAVGERNAIERESPLISALAQGVSKGDRMDFTIQKAVELGISRIVPLETERSVVNLKGERLAKKMRHWQGVIVSACEQCGRNTLPELLPLQTLDAWLENTPNGSGILLDHRATETIASLQSDDDFVLLVGPEGGLSESEIRRARESGYRGLRLGPRVLRTETAALTALAALQSRFGDLC